MEKKKSPFVVAEKLIKEKYPNFSVAFVGGSFNRNEQTATSDIDLVIVFPKVEQAYRESLVFEGWPIEVFIHDEETLNYFFTECDKKDGIPSLPSMVFEGPAIPANHPLGDKLKSLAKNILNEGPPDLSEDEKRNYRYMISDMLDDLKAPRNNFEGMIIAGKLHGLLAYYFFRNQNAWGAGAKHIPRQLQKKHPELFKVWESAFTESFKGNFKEVISLTEKILEDNGGYLFDGYSRMAPKDWRKSL